jgi:hypothetical protein
MGNKHSSYGVNGGYELSQARIEMLSAQTGLPNGKIVEWFEDFKSECKNGELNRKSFVRFYKELLPKKSEDSEKYCEFVFNGDHLFIFFYLEFIHFCDFYIFFS